MDLNKYQQESQKTDFTPSDGDIALAVPILGLGGEAGTLMTEYKKFLRDRESHRLFDERISEELGDALWYIATIATKRGLDLGTIAERNLDKCKKRWARRDDAQKKLDWHQHLYDESFPEHEQLPRQLSLRISQNETRGKAQTTVEWNGTQIGAALTDNSYAADGYRFHDAFHFAYAAILGWSPIARSILGRKRRSNSTVDEVEDGGRAKVIEEGISALVFAYARNHAYLEAIERIDFDLLRTIKAMTEHLEVRDRTEGEWERAILDGYNVWRQIMRHSGGEIDIDLRRQSIEFRQL